MNEEITLYESDADQPPPKDLTDLINEIRKSDGKLVPLPGRKSALDEALFISARYGDDIVPESGFQYLNIDVFALRDGKYIPVGIKDYEIRGKVAYSNKQRHQHLLTVNKGQEEADRYWATGEALHVRDDDLLKYSFDNGGFLKMNELRHRGVIQTDEDWTKKIYQGRGIGSLMVAVSILILNDRGVDKIHFGSFTKSAEAVWKKFGGKEGADTTVSELVKSPNISSCIKPFVKKNSI